MNEQKIKELVLATGVVEYDWRENMKYNSSEELVEKLIEVVVRECAKCINERTLDWDADLRWIFNDGSGDMAVDVDDVLNRHFGVER